MSFESDGIDKIRRAFTRLAVGWWIAALVVGSVVAFVAWVFLPWVVFGLFVYYVARPIERRLEGSLPSKNLSVLVTLTLVVVPIVTILTAAILVTLIELSVFLTGDVAARVEELIPFAVNVLPSDPMQLIQTVIALFTGGTVRSMFSSLSQTVGTIAASLYNAFLSLLFAFFLLREDHRLVAWFHTNVAAADTTVGNYLSAVDDGLESVYFGYTVTIFVVMFLAAVVYTLFNLVAPAGLAIPAPVPLAVVTGLFTIIPLVGRSIVYFVVAGYLVVRSLSVDPTSVWFPLVFLVVMELPFDNLIRVYVRPALSGRLFPMSLLVFAYLLGPPLFGWYGIFYGPLLMVVVVLFVQQVFPRLVHPERSHDPVGPKRAWDEEGEQTPFAHPEPDVDESVDSTD